MDYTFAVIIHCLTAALSLALLIVAIYKRPAPKSLYFAYLTFAIFIFTLGYLLEITATTSDAAIAGMQVQYFGIPFLAPLLLMFIMEYSGRPLRKRYIAALLVIPVLTFFVAVTYPWTGIYYEHVEFLINDVVPHLKVTGSIYYDIFFAYTYLIIIIAVVVSIYNYTKGDALFKKQSAILVVAAIIPAVGNVFSGITGALDITPTLLAITCLLLGYLFFRLGMFQIAPIARERVIETMNDGFALFDIQGRFIEANAAAKRLVPPLAKASMGTLIQDIEGIPWMNEEGEPGRGEFAVADEHGVKRFYRTSETAVEYKQRDICKCIMIYDITEPKRLLDEVSTLAEQDPLTGLINRRTFFASAEPKFHQIAKSGEPAAILMMDLDHFKHVNDTYGHIKGDEVLSAIAQRLARRFRNSDLFARYGGEELCALLTNADEEAALVIAEQLRATTERLAFLADSESFSVTISIGVAIYDSSRHRSLQSLLSEADAALYEAKRAGRNRVVMGEAVKEPDKAE